MQTFNDPVIRLARDRIDRELETAARRRLVASPEASIRRSVGRTFIRIGSRLAADPTERALELARSR